MQVLQGSHEQQSQNLVPKINKEKNIANQNITYSHLLGLLSDVVPAGVVRIPQAQALCVVC
jgi:hypothetical protein